MTDSRPHMNARALGIAGLTMWLLLAGCRGPFVLLPGGEPEGETAATPESWAFTDEVSTIQVETRPADPYSINIWAVGLDEYLYLHAGENRTTWIEHIEFDPLVRVRIDGTIYELRAARLDGADEFARFADAYEIKYGMRPRNENVAEVYLYRLGAR